MRKFGLIGYPLGHSFSRKYFSDKFMMENISDCVYNNYPLQTLDNFNSLISSDNEICGLNVTIPYKSDIIKFLDFTDSEASEIGAVNVIKIARTNGKLILYGYNSDVTGIRDTLSPFLKDRIKNAIVLGTGGASKAVCYVLAKYGLKVTKVSRKSNPDTLTYSEVTPSIISQTQIIVNTTPLGMFPDIDSKPDIDYSSLGKDHILFDLVYNPELTSFLREGKEQGCQIIGGIKMLRSQAERSWEIWNSDLF